MENQENRASPSDPLQHIAGLIKNALPQTFGRALSNEAEETGEYACPICRDAHYVHPLKEDGKTNYSRVVPCQCVRDRLEREKLQRMLRMCELPPGTEHMTFENFQVEPSLEEAYDSAVKLAEESADCNWLTLMSGSDRGKTHLLVAMCRRWLARGKPARYAYVLILLDELRRGFREEGDYSYEAYWKFFLNVPLLALDDLGTEHRTNWVQERLDTLIDYRLMNGLALVITTNLGMDELPFRIASRLQRRGKVVIIDAPEYRKEEGKDEHQ